MSNFVHIRAIRWGIFVGVKIKPMKRTVLFTFLSLFSLLLSAVNWYPKTNYGGTGRNRAFSFSIPSTTKGYFVGGYDFSYRKDTWSYDTLTNAWTQMSNFPGGSTVGAAFGIGNKGYAGCGTDAGYVMYDEFYEFDPALNTWTAKANFPGGDRSYVYYFTVNGKGYVGGGMDPSQNIYNDMYEFDPVTNTWIARAPFPGGARFLTAHMNIGSKGYVGMGMDGGFVNIYNDFYEYDPATNTWVGRAPLPAGNRGEPGCFSVCNKGFLTCGYSVPHTVFQNDLWSYDPTVNQWNQLASLPGAPRAYAPAFSIGKTGYIGTGFDGNSLYSDFYSVPFHDPNVNFTVSDSTLCPGQTVQFTDLSTGGNILTWNWSMVSGAPNTANIQHPTSNYNSPGTFDVILIVKNECSIDTLKKLNYITVFSNPIAVVSNDTMVCEGNSVALNASGGTTYQWSPGLFLNVNNTPVVISTPALPITYTVLVTDVNGCTDTDSTHVGIAPYPVASFNPDMIMGDAPLNVNFQNTSTGAISYFWDFGNAQTSILTEPSVIYTEYGEYPVMLVATNEYGCKDTAWYHTIDVTGLGFYIPNAFTPDGNGNNEIFNLEGYGMKSFDASVYDRWGHLLYRWNESQSGWDGKVNGEIVQEGVYIYKVSITMKDLRKYEPTGHLTLLK